jgi:Fic family protein
VSLVREVTVDIGRFQGDAPGKLVQIANGEHAFVPNRLPPIWVVPVDLWPLLSEAKQQLGILEGVGRTMPNPGILLRPLEDREAIQSSRLEGTYVTATEFLVFELEPKRSTSETDPANDRREVFNYRRALEQGMTSDLPLSLRLIRQMHKTLLTGVRGRDRTPGEFRRTQVAIGTDHRFIPPPFERLSECLDAFEKYLHAANVGHDPLVDCFLTHYQFETIHPFSDGNGRVGRLLLAVMLKERCLLSKPWLYMSEYFEKHHDEYAERLFNTSAANDWAGWIEFCLRGVVTQAKQTVARCERLREIRDAFETRIQEVGGAVRLHRIVEDIFHSPFIRIADLARRLEVTYPTANADVERLVQAGILQALGGISPKTYYAPEVFGVAYERTE